MRKIKYLLSVPLIVCLIFLPAYAEIDDDCFAAYKALKRIEAMMESGVAWADYSKAVSEATLEVKLVGFKAGELKDVLKWYQMAKDLWNADLKMKLIAAHPTRKNLDDLDSVERDLLFEQAKNNIKEFSKALGTTHRILKEADKLFPGNDLVVDGSAGAYRVKLGKQLLWNKASQLLKEYKNR